MNTLDNRKETYYVNIETGEVLQQPIEDTNFRIFADEDEVTDLMGLLGENYDDDLKTFGAAHIPYRNDLPENKEYDQTLNKVYEKIYVLGDEKAKRHIEGMGILSEPPISEHDNV